MLFIKKYVPWRFSTQCSVLVPTICIHPYAHCLCRICGRICWPTSEQQTGFVWCVCKPPRYWDYRIPECQRWVSQLVYSSYECRRQSEECLHFFFLNWVLPHYSHYSNASIHHFLNTITLPHYQRPWLWESCTKTLASSLSSLQRMLIEQMGRLSRWVESIHYILSICPSMLRDNVWDVYSKT